MKSTVNYQRAAVIALLVLALISLAGCAGVARLPQCEGPWVPVNPTVEAADET